MEMNSTANARSLTLHLKRFRHEGKATAKLDSHVPFPPTLELAAGEQILGATSERYEISCPDRVPNFYLVPHHGLKGTSVPLHFHVLANSGAIPEAQYQRALQANADPGLPSAPASPQAPA